MNKPARKPQLLTKDQRAAIERELSVPFGRVDLKADGHELRLRVERCKALRYVILVYVDGWLRGEWFKAGNDIGAKFWRRRVVQAFSKKQIESHRKLFGKRDAAALVKRGTIAQHCPDFASGRAVLTHLQRTCDGIEVVSVGYQPGEPDEVRQEETADA